jgi:hypothetical protein
MIKSMPHMLFPRYIGRDGRDFMYLTLRSVLPGSPLIPRVAPPEPNEGVWRTKGLPQHGFPYAIATTIIRPDSKHPEVHARVLKIDPRTVKIATEKSDGKETVLALSAGAKPEKGNTQLWLAPGSFAIGNVSPGPTAVALFAGEEAKPEALATATTLAGITDDDGTLVIAIADGPAGPSLRALLAQLGCSQVLIPPKGLDLRLGGSLDLGGELAKTPLAGTIVTIDRAQAPAARELFPGTPVVDPAVWQPLQAKRVRYFGKKVVRPGTVPTPAPTAPAPKSSAN